VSVVVGDPNTLWFQIEVLLKLQLKKSEKLAMLSVSEPIIAMV
jgi:hypothetical protein